MDISKATLEALIREIVEERLKKGDIDPLSYSKHILPEGVAAVKVPELQVSPQDRLDTGDNRDIVYTKDLFSLEESPRLGCGIMEMTDTTFDWTLNYDELDYVIEGCLKININGKSVEAKAGEMLLIPKGSKIQFSVEGHARFIYVTYPADWAKQG
jgi:ethanolamine utilization protein EutQ